MTKNAMVMTDLKEILSTVQGVSKVSFKGHVPLSEEDSYPSIYIIAGADTYTERSSGLGISAYNNSFFVRVIVNEDCSNNPLQWAETKDLIIRAVLDDKRSWDNFINRDIRDVSYDDMNSFPYTTFEILFEFTTKESCDV